MKDTVGDQLQKFLKAIDVQNPEDWRRASAWIEEWLIDISCASCGKRVD